MLGDFIHSNFDKTPVKDKAKRRQLNKVSSSPDSTVECTKHDLEDIELLSQIDSGSPHRDLKHKFKEFVGHFDHTPNFLQFNHFLRTGYRINFNTPRKVFKSLFMLHNESVNIWTHLCGAIALIIISVFLCFSVNSFDSHSLQIFVKEEVQTIFNPIYHSLPNFTISENDFPEKMLHAREDTVKIGDSTLSNFEMTLHSISEEIKHVKENLSPKAIGIFLNKLRDELDDYSNMFQGGLKSSITFSREKKEKIRQMTERVETELNELQSKLVKKIDSDAFDWIDIYRYIDASYNSALRSENEYLKVPISRWPIIVFMLSAVFCLLCSAVYHAFHCMSTKASDVLSRLDYAGISILITGSCFPAFVYGFYCQPFYSKLYLSLIGVTSVIVFIVSLGEKIHTFEYSVQKSCMYASLVFFAILPSSHLIYLNVTATEGSDNLDFIPSIPYYLTMILCYLIGLIIYATKYPEKCCPGKFDILGHSHQIWHVCILFGIFFTYLGAFDNYYTRIKIPCIGCGL